VQILLLGVALEDTEFSELFNALPDYKIEILQGGLEGYLGSAYERAEINRDYARSVFSRQI